MRNILFLLSILFTFKFFAQDNITHKEFKIVRVKNAPNIDGVLDDDAWKNANVAKDFVMFRPRSNEPEQKNKRTEVKVVYDDNAIYFGAYLYDDKPDEIPMEFQTRDNFGNADFFGIVLNPQNDGQNQTEFFIMSTGNQNDALVTPNNGEDFSWNAVWDSSVKVVEDGWIVEVKIPYAALRFSNEKVQTWGLNFHRRHQSNRDQYTWNFIDRENGNNIAQYDGIITGIENIQPPIRLSFNPFISSSVTDFANETDFNWSAGLDVKYGITENFTLDATLIPDFGQAAFDNVTLNLGPFEQFFSEQRAFFNEGTDLFNKGGFFNSRRIGSSPIGDVTLNSNEETSEYPSKVDVLNIVKVSGRTKKGLGVGVLNAITEKTYATIKNTDNQTTRKEVVEPLSNYSVVVVDQQFNRNSSVSLVNTNVTRNGSFRDANVTGLLFDVNTKNNKFGVEGGIAMSNVYNGNGQNPVTGLEGGIEFGKSNGNHQYYAGMDFQNKRYDKNDLGFQRTNNTIEYEAGYSYRIFEPKGKLNNYRIGIWGELNYLMELDKNSLSYQEKSNLYRGNEFGFNFNANTKKQFAFGVNGHGSFGNQYNYFEPRVEGRFFKMNPVAGFNQWISTDYSKKFAIDVNYYYGFRINETRNHFNFNFRPRYRVNDKISLRYAGNFNISKNQKGAVDYLEDTDEIIFGNRDVRNLTNSLTAKYNFSTNAQLSLSLRHFWSRVRYDDQFFELEQDGDLTTNDYTGTDDINFNTWNFDLNFNWQFAPGSQIIALYRNSIFNQNEDSYINFSDNIDGLFKEDILNNVSLRIVYYLDYNQVKSVLQSKS